MDVASGGEPAHGPCPAHADAAGLHRDPEAGQVTFDTSGNPSVSRTPTILQDSVVCSFLTSHLVARRANLTSPSRSLHSHRSPEEVVSCCIGFLVLASDEGKEVHRGTRRVAGRTEEIMRARSDKDVTILPAACIPAGVDYRAGLTSPAPTFHHTITGAAPTINTFGGRP